MNIINLQIQIFLLMLIGYILAKKNIIDIQVREKITKMIMSVILPCAIIKSFNIALTIDIIESTFMVLIISIGIQLLYYLLNNVLYKKMDEEKKIICKYGTMVSNAGFMGMPIAECVFGSQGLLYASIFLIPQRICMCSFGLTMFDRNSTTKNIIKKVLLHPCIVSIFIGIFIMILKFNGYELPTAVISTINSMANCNTALSMIVIGAVLSEVNLKGIFEKEICIYSLNRLILLPILIWAILYITGIKGLTANVCILLSAMPAASTTVMLSQEYNINPKFSSKIVFVSTVFSLITLPIIVSILSYL